MKYRASIIFPQGIIFENYDHKNGWSSASLSSEIILASNDFRKIKNRALEIANKYSAAYIDIANLDNNKPVFFTCANELDYITNDENFNSLAWEHYSKYPKVIIKRGKLGYSDSGWFINLDV